MKVTFDLDSDQFHEFMVIDLKQAYYDCGIPNNFFDDVAYSKKFKKALRKVIQYYSIPSEYDAWLKSVKENIS